MDNTDLLEYLKALEIELHQPMCRSDSGRLEELLHDSFVEFGRGGIIFSKQSVIDELSEEDGSLNVFSQNYSLQLVQSNTALLLYRSAHIKPDGRLHRFSNRSSYWIFENERWQMCFHQGTPTDEFDKQSI